jgi:hypothetical protein
LHARSIYRSLSLSLSLSLFLSLPSARSLSLALALALSLSRARAHVRARRGAAGPQADLRSFGVTIAGPGLVVREQG